MRTSVITERIHAFLRPRSSHLAQSLRLPGRPWDHTRALRERMPPRSLTLGAVFHARMFSLMDDDVIKCWRKRCGVHTDECRIWTIESAAHLQRDLGEQMGDAVTGRSIPHDVQARGALGKTANLVISIAWLRK